MNKFIQYIRESNQKSNFSIMGIPVILDSKNIKKINYKNVVQRMVDTIPAHLYRGIKKIVISPTEKLKKRNLQGLYSAKKIYLTGQQPSEDEILDDLIHEVSHHVEEKYGTIIYSDNKIKKEFLIKRKQLKKALDNSGYETEDLNFGDDKYDAEFDNYLYSGIGYDKLGTISSSIFYSPYAATSLREYFANGFEAFYMKENISLLKRVSPELYRKIIILHNGEINNV